MDMTSFMIGRASAGGGGGGGYMGMQEVTITLDNDVQSLTQTEVSWVIQFGEYDWANVIKSDSLVQSGATQIKVPYITGQVCYIQALSANNQSYGLGSSGDGTTLSGSLAWDDGRIVYTGDGTIHAKWNSYD